MRAPPRKGVTRAIAGFAAIGFLCALAPLCGPARADDDFAHFIAGLWPDAQEKGVSRTTFERAFAGVTPDLSILEAAGSQPEFTRAVWDYVTRATSDKRIERGRDKLRELNNVLNAIEAVHGVDRHVIVAIWGMETSYGEFRGDKSVVRSLATLAYRGRRAEFGRSQLLAALQILQRGDTVPERMTGSWAGAMGHTQFIPTTYNAYAVDFDGDGRRDIWDTITDALASTAHYLRVSGWEPGLPWGYEVTVPTGFNYELAESEPRPIREWEQLGVRPVGGNGLEHEEAAATLIMPAGARGPAFLALRNFRAILRYNNAVAYALSVGHLADRLRGGAPIAADWPISDRPLSNSARRELQNELARRGYSIGPVDGVLGVKTRAAIKAYQKSAGMPPDGYASEALLDHLKN